MTVPGPVSIVTRTVRDIAHVIPGWVKVLMLALAALVLTAALIALLAALRNRRLRALTERLRDEVGTLSLALLPAIPERVGALGVSVAYRPAAGLAAGGDFYDVFPLDGGRVGIIVGDVSGHGREALGPATFIRHMIRSYLEAGLAPRHALQLAGDVVEEQDREDFTTVVTAIHDPSTGTLCYAMAGHPPPVVLGPGSHSPLTVAAAPPIGAGYRTGLRQTTVAVAAGSRVVLFTDGLLEARRGSGVLGSKRLEELIAELPPTADADDLIRSVAAVSDALPDDVVVCLLSVESGRPTMSTLRVEELEVTRADLGRPGVRRFLAGCGVEGDQAEDVLRRAAARAVHHGSVLLRVRLADDRSGVDVLPAHASGPNAQLAVLGRL